MDPAERRMYAYDAYASVTFLSLLIFLWGAISLATVPMRPFGPWNLLQTVGGAAAVCYFVATRHRPSTQIAVSVAVVMIVYSLILLPWTATVWASLGRPWEAFTVPQMAMVAVALVAPRYFWLGVGVVTLFAAESLFAYVYARQRGLASAVPPTEPYFSLFFAILSVGVLMLRDQRRRLMLRHIRVQAEGEALRQIGPTFTRFRDQLGVYLAALEHQLGLMRDGSSPSRPLRRIDRAVRRLSALNETLHALDDGAVTTAAPADRPARRGDRSTSLVASEAERRLLAHDAHTATTIFIGMLAATTPVILIEHEVVVGPSLFPFAIGEAILIFAMLLYVVATRRHPSERRATYVVLVVYLALLPILIADEKSLLAMNRPYAPFMGHKFLMVSMALVAGSRLRLGIALNLLTWASAIVTFYVLGLHAHRELVSVAEPWVTTVYMMIGMVILVMRERRRVASIEVLRAESDAAAQYRRVALILAFRDQLNSPLQSLLSSAVLLDLGSPRGHNATPIRVAVDGLVSLSRDLNRIEDAIPGGSSGLSFDGANVLVQPK